MFEQLNETLSTFTDSWNENLREGRNQLRLTLENAEIDECLSLIEDTEAIARTADAGSLSFNIIGSGEEYEIQYTPSSNFVTGSRDQSSGTPISQNYRGNDELVETLTNLKNGVLTNKEDVIQSLQVVDSGEQHQIDIGYTIRTSRIENAIAQELNDPNTSVSFYFSWPTFSSYIQESNLTDIRHILLNGGTLTRSIIVILEIDEFVQGDSLSVYGLKRLASEGYNTATAGWTNQMDNIRRQTLIQEPDQRFLPPSFFQFDRASSRGWRDEVMQLFYPHIALFSILSIANTAEFQDESVWNIRIQGRQYIEGKIEGTSTNRLSVTFGDSSTSVELTKARVESLYSLYCWVYDHNSDNRISVVRNVATLYARNIADLVTGADEIESSAESNRRYYMKESVDEFFEFRQELTENAFETQSRFAELRSELMTDLSRDLFRTFAFIVAIAATAIFRLSDVLPPVPTYLAVSGILVIYSSVTFRRVRGIRTQFLDLIETQKKQMDFYSDFFDEDELKERGVGSNNTCPWWGTPFQIWWKLGNKEVEYMRLRLGFALDLCIYYMLILMIVSIATLLFLEALSITNIVSAIPGPGTA